MTQDNERLLQLVPRIRKFQSEGRKIIYMDEVSFGSWTLPEKEWSAIRSNITLPSQLTAARVVKAIVGISHEKGLEPYSVFYDKLDSDRVCEWIDMQDFNDKIVPAFFFDNASYNVGEQTSGHLHSLGAPLLSRQKL